MIHFFVLTLKNLSSLPKSLGEPFYKGDETWER